MSEYNKCVNKYVAYIFAILNNVVNIYFLSYIRLVHFKQNINYFYSTKLFFIFFIYFLFIIPIIVCHQALTLNVFIFIFIQLIFEINESFSTKLKNCSTAICSRQACQMLRYRAVEVLRSNVVYRYGSEKKSLSEPRFTIWSRERINFIC